MFKYNMDQTVYYMMDNRVHSAPVLARRYVETAANIPSRAHVGENSIVYGTTHGTFHERNLFTSLKDLLNYLGENVKAA